MDADLPTIRTERIVGVRHTGLGLSWLAIVPLCLSVVGFRFAVLVNRKAHARSMKSINQWAEQEARDKFQLFIGRTPQYMDVAAAGAGHDLSAISASGIAYADGRLFILEEGLAAELPWNCVRSWTWKIGGYSQTEMHGRRRVGAQLSIDASNRIRRALAQRASGFIIKTSSIGKPEWRFQTRNTVVLTKWLEILTQMRDGRLARA